MLGRIDRPDAACVEKISDMALNLWGVVFASCNYTVRSCEMRLFQKLDLVKAGSLKPDKPMTSIDNAWFQYNAGQR